LSHQDHEAQTGAELELSLDIKGMIGRVADTLKGVKDSAEAIHKFLTENSLQAAFSRKITMVKTAANPAAAFMYIDMGAPPAGFIWDVRRYTVVGPDPTAAVVGTLFTFIGPPPADGAVQPGSYSDMVDPPNATIPNSAKWSRGDLTLLQGEHFIVALKGLPNAQTIIVSMQVQQFREDDRASVKT
jgi:hypothetical protein